MNSPEEPAAVSQVLPSLSRSATVTRAEAMIRKPTSMTPTRTKNELSIPLVSRRTWKAARRRIGIEKNAAKRVGIRGHDAGDHRTTGAAPDMTCPDHSLEFRHGHQVRPRLGQDGSSRSSGQHEPGRDRGVRRDGVRRQVGRAVGVPRADQVGVHRQGRAEQLAQVRRVRLGVAAQHLDRRVDHRRAHPAAGVAGLVAHERVAVHLEAGRRRRGVAAPRPARPASAAPPGRRTPAGRG